MLTTTAPGTNRRQWVFFAFLFLPILGLMYILGIFLGRQTEILYPIAFTAGILGIIGSLVTLGINWRLGLYLIMFFVLWDRVLGFGPTGTVNATKIAIGLTFIYLLTAICNNQLPNWWRRLADPLPVAGFAYILVSAFSVIFMPEVPEAASTISRRINIVVLLLIFLIGVTDREVFHRAIVALIIGGTLVAIATLSEPITGVGLLERVGKTNPDIGSGVGTLRTYQGSFRITGPSGGPNFYGIAMSLSSLLAFGLLLYYKEWWKKALLVLSLGVMVFNIIGTGSRGGGAAFLAGVMFVFLLCPVRHRFVKLATALAVIVVGVFVLIALDSNVAANRIATPQDADWSSMNRVAMWHMAVDMYKDHPIAGVGAGGWGFYYPDYRIPPVPDRLLRTHNSFVQMLAETGIQGVVSYTLLYLFAGLSVFCAAFGTRDRRLKFQSMAFAATLAGFFVFAGSNNVLENELYFIVFGMCGAAYTVYRQERAMPPGALGEDELPQSARTQRLNFLQARQHAMYPPGA